MKRKFILSIQCLGVTLLLFCEPSFSQSTEDSVMLTKSERWTVKPNKGLFGLSKPDFGPYFTLGVTKVDSPVIKKKTREGSYMEGEISSDGASMNHMKLMSIEKTKFYKLQLGTQSDTTEAVFAIASLSKEKRQTLLGTILSSKNDGSNDAVLSYKRDIPGIIYSYPDSVTWEFFIDDFTSGGRQTEGKPFAYPSINGGFLKNPYDSLYLLTHSLFTAADVSVKNVKGEHLAGLKYKQKPLYIWIRNDLSANYQKAIATLFGVIISIKDY